jgi:NAD(P)-dependent dehydrogenase (short-subunit alcohol dehydrogenase family)
LVAIVDLDAAAAERAAAQVHETQALGIAADVTDRGATQRAVATTVERFGGLDVVVANAGIATRVATFRAMSSDSFQRVLDVNLMGVYRTVDAALPEIISRRGHLVVISSVYAFLNGVGATPYAMSKAAVEQFGRALRAEVTQHGASASVAYFGYIDTEMVHRAIDQDPLADQLLATVPRPLRKRLPPSAAAEAIVRGIERRQPRIIRPRRWVVTTQDLIRRIDARAGEEQSTTA